MNKASPRPRRRTIAAALSLSVIGAAVGVTGVGIGTAKATTNCTYQDNTFTGLQNHVFVASNGFVYCLSGNISQTLATLNVPPSVSITIDLQGHNLNVNNDQQSSSNEPAIRVPSAATLTIQDSVGGGALSAVGDDGAAGIGGGQNTSSGNLVIDSGTVNAFGGGGAAGIGGGGGVGIGGTVTINGGTVNAHGGSGGAGIGGGGDSGSGGGAGGTVTITGGTVNAYGGILGAGIGGGQNSANVGGAGGAVSVSGGTVHAVGGTGGGAGIGAGDAGGPNGSLTIYGTCNTTPASACQIAAGNGYNPAFPSDAAVAQIGTPSSGIFAITAVNPTNANGNASATIQFGVPMSSPSGSPSGPAPSASASASVAASATSAQVSVASLPRGNTLTVTGSGFVFGESVAIYLHSTPVLLGTTIASGTGTITANVTIPAGTAVGAHQIELRGTQTTASAFANLTVTAAKVNSGGVADAASGTAWPWALLLGLGGMLLAASGVAAHRVRRAGGER